MIRYYCDVCGEELGKADHNRLQGSVQSGEHSVKVEVISGVDGAWNEGHLCHACVLTVVQEVAEQELRVVARMEVQA